MVFVIKVIHKYRRHLNDKIVIDSLLTATQYLMLMILHMSSREGHVAGTVNSYPCQWQL